MTFRQMPLPSILSNYASADHDASASISAGRPLIENGQARTAAPATRDDWLADIEMMAARSPDLAEHWSQVAAVEHASVASFARCTMELMAIGCPSSLLAEMQAAGADEVEHARICYALASLYSGEFVGPGPLDLTDLSLRTEPQAILVALIDEACITETLSALEAAEAADRVEDPALAKLLTQIAEDEQRHAELGWRTLSWLLREYPELVEVARARFVAFRPSISARGPAHLEAHGVLAPASRMQSTLLGLREVVWPAVETILGAPASSGRTPGGLRKAAPAVERGDLA